MLLKTSTVMIAIFANQSEEPQAELIAQILVKKNGNSWMNPNQYSRQCFSGMQTRVLLLSS